MRDGLVLADRPVEDDAFARIANRAVDGAPADADRLCRDHDALRVEAVEQAAKPLPYFADDVRIADDEVADEDFVRVDRVAPELRNLADLAAGTVEVREKERRAVERLRALVAR